MVFCYLRIFINVRQDINKNVYHNVAGTFYPQIPVLFKESKPQHMKLTQLAYLHISEVLTCGHLSPLPSDVYEQIFCCFVDVEDFIPK